MDITFLSGETLYKAFISGTMEVKRNKNKLNRMNVFPIPDGDTGSNLLYTMESIITETKHQESMKKTLDSMAKAALGGARGNSGIIFAQFLHGINEEFKDFENCTIKSFAETLKKAVPYAYNAILNPIEGTMITVIREWVEAIYHLKDVRITFEEMITQALDAARKALENTPNQLSTLKKASVVDSGGNGFVLFLEGMVNFLQRKEVEQLPEYEEEAVTEENFVLTEQLQYRYCTEAFLTNITTDSSKIKQAIKGLGDSLIVAGSKENMRVHIHTNEPDKLFSILRGHGSILQQKVDDMKKQFQTAHQRLHKIALLTDSIADLPDTLIDQYQIHVIPLNLMLEGSSYLDKVTIKPDCFYSLLDQLNEYPTSSQPTQAYIDNLFSFLSSHYDSIIAMIVSKEMSGTFQVVKKASEKLIKDGYPIAVIDTKQNSGAEGLLVLHAAKALEQGKGHEEIVNLIEYTLQKTKIYVSINTFKYMVKGGRVSKAIGILGKLLNIKPIISIDENGKGIAFGKAFSSKSNIKKILQLVTEDHQENRIKSYCVVHAHAPQRATLIGDQLTGLLGKAPDYITEISPIVGLNAGKGAVAVAYIME